MQKLDNATFAVADGLCKHTCFIFVCQMFAISIREFCLVLSFLISETYYLIYLLYGNKQIKEGLKPETLS